MDANGNLTTPEIKSGKLTEEAKVKIAVDFIRQRFIEGFTVEEIKTLGYAISHWTDTYFNDLLEKNRSVISL